MVLVPVMGVGWTVGMFAVSEETVFLQFIFAIFNSSQVNIYFNNNPAQKQLCSVISPNYACGLWKPKRCDQNDCAMLICSFQLRTNLYSLT